MRKLFLFTFLVLTSTSAFAQKDYAKDVASMEAILTALYDVISGPAGEKRDWDRMRNLFIPEARLMPSGLNAQTGKVSYVSWTPEQYIKEAGSNLEKNGFFEVEIARKVEKFGTVTHVFSTYESRRNADDEKPFVRGINSIQLLEAHDRWYIVNIFWMGETQQFPIPDKYLKN